MTPADIRKLQDLAEQGKLRDLAIYSKFVQRHGDIMRQVDDLQARVDNNEDTSDLTALVRWESWAERERTKLVAMADAMHVEKENARKVAVKSAAKVEALGILLKDALKAQLILNRRRAEQNGMPPDA